MEKRYYELFYKIVLNKWYEKNKLNNLKKRVIDNIRYTFNASLVL